ncbi:alpha/beta hydrolase family protein [Sphingosinicella terrae]|uniref:alpha/beta hydrolase family protein n=1 Tax=Sphingosinicella terrae TaxID=2172047 RepID=UPI000E0DEF21|nr:dienelactone hydrolase [Sphingosinicella terrae]
MLARALTIAFLLLAAGCAAPAAAAVTVCEAVWRDPSRARDLPVRIRMPPGDRPVPAILFSHGLGGSLDSGSAWSDAWSDAGFAVINLQHPGSDRSILTGGRVSIMRAMAPRQLAERARDVRFVIDRLAAGGAEGDCSLERIDSRRVGLSGHSYGAHTTQAVAGQDYPAGALADLADPRVRAAIAFSPSPPMRGPAEPAFDDVAIPFFSITGTRDEVPFLPQIGPADRERPFRAMPPGGKYLLVLDGATHMTFNAGGERRRGQPPPDPRHVRIVAGATIDFWRWTLNGDEVARRRLEALPERLAPGDRFERK